MMTIREEVRIDIPDQHIVVYIQDRPHLIIAAVKGLGYADAADVLKAAQEVLDDMDDMAASC
jgi:hypothetical protein